MAVHRKRHLSRRAGRQRHRRQQQSCSRPSTWLSHASTPSAAAIRVSLPTVTIPSFAENRAGSTLRMRRAGWRTASAPCRVLQRHEHHDPPRRVGAVCGWPGFGVTTNVSSSTSTPAASFHVCMTGARGETVCCRTHFAPPTISGCKADPETSEAALAENPTAPALPCRPESCRGRREDKWPTATTAASSENQRDFRPPSRRRGQGTAIRPSRIRQRAK